MDDYGFTYAYLYQYTNQQFGSLHISLSVYGSFAVTRSSTLLQVDSIDL